MNAAEFAKKAKEDSASQQWRTDRITKIQMNTSTNQGTIIFVPFENKKDGGFYYKLAGVREWNGHTTRVNFKSVWYRVLPEEYYGNLSNEDKELLSEINGLLDTLGPKGEYKNQVNFKMLRNRNYTLMYGVLLRHTGANNVPITENDNKPCLFVFPSLSPIESINKTIEQENIMTNGNVNWLDSVMNNKTTGREGVLIITFDRPQSGGGYETTVGFKINDKVTAYIDPKRVFDEEITKYFNDPLQDLLGWQNGKDSYFNAEIMRELKDDLRIKLRELQNSVKPTRPEPIYPNRNGNQDPMKNGHISQGSTQVTQGVAVEDPKGVLADLPF